MPSIPMIASDGRHLSINLLLTTAQEQYAEHWIARTLESRRLGSTNSVVSLTDYQTNAIQVVAMTMASVSTVASLLALYWFYLMRRNFRRDLVLLLILSDIFKNFCYILYSGVNLAQGPVDSEDSFCQASGYMLQTGLEACDFAILFISLHMALQIFPLPNTILGYDGLYNIRYLVYFLWFTLPNLTASLAFLNGSDAYQVQGAWCWLPVRPFWYRLALAWVPRYLITILILCFAITIYVYVGTEFRLLGRERDRASSSGLDSTTSGTPRTSAAVTPPATVREHSATDEQPGARRLLSLGALSHAPDHTTSYYQYSSQARRNSMPVWTSPFDGNSIICEGQRDAYSAGASRRGSKQVTFDRSAIMEEPLSPLQRPYIPFAEQDESPTSAPQADADLAALDLPTLAEAQTNASVTASAAMETAIKARRRAIRRQTRGLFIYPVAYMIFWIIPFVMHCMNYSDYYAEHPIFAIQLMASLCTTSLGLVDVIIFCWREQPWRHINGNDGTFLGSFCFWRHEHNLPFMRRTAVVASHEYNEKEENSSNASALLHFLRVFRWRRLSSSAGTHTTASNRSSSYKPRQAGGADSAVREREQAQIRLQMEREAFERRQNVIPEQRLERIQQHRSPGGRNWFDSIE